MFFFLEILIAYKHADLIIHSKALRSYSPYRPKYKTQTVFNLFQSMFRFIQFSSLTFPRSQRRYSDLEIPVPCGGFSLYSLNPDGSQGTDSGFTRPYIDISQIHVLWLLWWILKTKLQAIVVVVILLLVISKSFGVDFR